MVTYSSEFGDQISIEVGLECTFTMRCKEDSHEVHSIILVSEKIHIV